MSDVNLPASELGITPKDMGIAPAEPSIEILFGNSFEIKKLENGKPISVGHDTESHNINTHVIGDFDHFDPLLQEMHKVAVLDAPQLQQWLETKQIPFDARLLATLSAFTNGLNWKYPNSSVNANARWHMYDEAKKMGTQVKLSDIFENNSAECAEVTALAQYFLQSEGVDSSFFGGELLVKKDDEFAGAHSFIVLRDKDRQYIFDPYVPTKIRDRISPSLYAIEGDFDAEVRKGQKRFVTGTNIFNKRQLYFGVGDGTEVSPANIAP